MLGLVDILEPKVRERENRKEIDQKEVAV